MYQCFILLINLGGEQVVATALSGTDLSVTWEQPPMHYFNETVALSPALKGNV